MRRPLALLAISFASTAAAAFALSAPGCGTFNVDCLQHGLCSSFREPDAGPPDGPILPDCAGDPTVDPTLVRDECGIFVRGDPTDADDAPDAGTQAHPFKTLQAAINAATGKWIFVCTKNPFSEQVTIAKDNIALYGGYDCSSNWAFGPDTRSVLNGPPDQIAMTVSGSAIKVQNFTIQAGDAAKAGGSSIAVLVNAANPSFTRCDLQAGKPM